MKEAKIEEIPTSINNKTLEKLIYLRVYLETRSIFLLAQKLPVDTVKIWMEGIKKWDEKLQEQEKERRNL